MVLMLLLVFFFSIFDFGYVMFEHHTILHRARTAARYGAINPGDLNGTRSMVLYSTPTPPDNNATAIFGLTSSMVSVTRIDASTPEDRINITVSGYHYTFITPGMAGVFVGRPIQISMPVETQ